MEWIKAIYDYVKGFIDESRLDYEEGRLVVYFPEVEILCESGDKYTRKNLYVVFNSNGLNPMKVHAGSYTSGEYSNSFVHPHVNRYNIPCFGRTSLSNDFATVKEDPSLTNVIDLWSKVELFLTTQSMSGRPYIPFQNLWRYNGGSSERAEVYDISRANAFSFTYPQYAPILKHLLKKDYPFLYREGRVRLRVSDTEMAIEVLKAIQEVIKPEEIHSMKAVFASVEFNGVNFIQVVSNRYQNDFLHRGIMFKGSTIEVEVEGFKSGDMIAPKPVVTRYFRKKIEEIYSLAINASKNDIAYV